MGFDTPVFRGIPRYFPNIGTPEEMSPINDVTHDYENDIPPVIEVTPGDKNKTTGKTIVDYLFK